eukprot:CAMPEP_0179080550 /NCGR_PEP_ID=MMETSP0796-20121207/36209_1 /TAXON_ID=73915 /ORGANISM="Pyrodinium bahamense, Strain pbaha01" /LENGTH=353 /DNA_ID=CAMNT_0020777907 /DNA_START=93 /DNA_END=1154 /DNA_ORIENTATION=+
MLSASALRFHSTPDFKPGCVWRYRQAEEMRHQFRPVNQLALDRWSGSRPTKNPNMCIDGRLLPELYVLGSPKCATTSLSTDLRRAGVPSDVEPEKESNFFNCLAEEVDDRLQHISAVNYSNWLAEHPTCRDSDPRRVLADYTPNNLRMVPEVPKDDFNMGGNDLPRILHSTYGKKLERLTMVVMLREPLHRMQSAFYYNGGRPGYFEWSVVSSLDSTEEGRPVPLSFMDVFYARLLEGWLRYFQARQFYIIPFREYVAREGGKDAVFEDLSERISFPLVPPGTVTHALRNTHPTVEQDVSASVTARFNRFIDGQNARLVSLLANMSSQGAGLAGYHGAKGSERSISEWLRNGW